MISCCKRIRGPLVGHFNDDESCNNIIHYFRLKKANNNLAPSIVAVWSSGLTSAQCLSRHNFAVQVWGGSTWQENHELLMGGFNIVISHVDAWYLDCGFGSWRTTGKQTIFHALYTNMELTWLCKIGDGACAPYTTWQHAYKHRPWERMRLEPSRLKQVHWEFANRILFLTHIELPV